MGKLMALGSGMIGGYIAGKQMEEREARNKLWDDVARSMIKKPEKKAEAAPAEPKTVYVERRVTDPNDAAVLPVPEINNQLEVSPGVKDDPNPPAYANGGLVTPVHADRFSWQKQSFKKGR